MAEKFQSFNGSLLTTSSSEFVIVPSGSSVGNTSSTGSRDNNTVAQVHSIYICQRPSSKYKSLERYNSKNFSAFNLYIKNVNTNAKTYIVFDGRIVPGAPFFIEKNITLEPTHQLCIECPSDSYDYDNETNTSKQLNTTSEVYIDVSASAVIFPRSN